MPNYAASKDATYLELLKIAKLSDNSKYSSQQLNNIVNALNSLNEYQFAHKRIIPLLRFKAKKLNVFGLLELDIQQLLNKETQKGVITELGQRSQLASIVKALSAENIPVILLKGSAFADSIYKANAPRTSNDIDILVKGDDWEQAKKIISLIMKPLPIKKKQVFDNLYETSFIPKSKMGATVDLHKSLVHPYLFNINEKQLWQESVRHNEYASDLVRVLSPEHAINHQALHAFKDMDFSKYNLVDVHEIIKQNPINLAKAFAIAKQWGSSIPLFVLLSNCSQIMGTFSLEEIKLIQESKPNLVTQVLCEKLLKSKMNKLSHNSKTFKYRILQLMSQFVFTGSLIRPISLQWMFIKTMMKNKK
ncbi:nucleotidyltransferase domain-containing protein [Pseudocolwellia agarivorans]|uniref:nucleotidyltransferase domain-containing protein n=1 Tax=Pseudocolwellia agarivorans TaxID=1911682 RepID=UPI003F8815B2